MKIAVSATGKHLESIMDLKFGRATNFIIIETNTLEYEAIDNAGSASSGGAGISAAQMVADMNAKAVITGNVGPNAMNVLKAANIEIYKGNEVSVKENVEQFKKGVLKKISTTVPAHFGMGKTTVSAGLAASLDSNTRNNMGRSNMLIAIATDAGYVSSHFGRCQAYTMVDIANGKVEKKELVPNPGHEPGAIPAFLHHLGAKRIVCGGIGARATELFGEYGIQITAGIDGSVDQTIEKLTQGSLMGGESLCNPGAGRGFGIEKTECDHAHE